jgi:leucyl aminopeptidase
MKFFLKPSDPQKLDVDALTVFVWEEEFKNKTFFNPELTKEIKEAAAKEKFSAKEKESLIISSSGLMSAYKLILVGLGSKEEFDFYKLYEVIAFSIRLAKDIKAARIGLIIDELWFKDYTVAKTTKAIVEAVSLSSYHFLKYKGEKEKEKFRPIEEIWLAISPAKVSACEEGRNMGLIVAEAINFARDLVNEPPEYTSPLFLSLVAKELAKDSKDKVKVKILEKEEIAKLGMNAFLGVAVGSDKPPKFIHLSYKPTLSKKKIILIGKGITFDTGGLSLKTYENMETMKLDMSGAAAVLAVFKAIPEVLPKVEVVGLIPACENMPGSKALKPGDILKALDGKTIEILNTDAEGRLTLADTICYAKQKEKSDEIIDLATLTGACMVALGQEVAGLFGNNDKLIENMEKSAKEAGERVWRMPLFRQYKELLKSHIADIKNVQSGKYGGAISAALFLSEFVGKTPWVHLDIAGPAYAEKDSPLTPVGGTGFGVATLLTYLSSF